MKKCLLYGILIIIIKTSAHAQSWSNHPVGPDGIVTSIAAYGNGIYVGGDFSKVSGADKKAIASTKSIAYWNGSLWTALGTGLNGSVTDMALAANGDLYVTGQFTTAGAVAAKGIARWDGTNWYPVGSGIDGSVNATNVPRTLAFDASGNLYMGGSFSGVDGVEGTKLIAVWNGSAWASVGNPFGTIPGSPEVRTILPDGDNVYIGGAFSSAAGTNNTRSVAVWNSASATWSSLGNLPLSVGASVVIDIEKVGSKLYLAGAFTNAFTIANATNIAGWDLATGKAFALGNGLSSGTVASIAITNGMLYAGGEFQYDGTEGDINFLARWDGTTWSNPTERDGFDTVVRTVEIAGTKVLAGGDFITVDGEQRYYFAFMNDSALPVDLVYFKAKPFGNEVELSWQSAQEENFEAFEVQRSLDLREFSTVQRVVAKGSSAQKTFYSFIDKDPTQGINYYRLILRDRDGSFKVSRIVQANVDVRRTDVLAYPNPFNGKEINLKVSAGKLSKVVLIDSQGQSIPLTTTNNQIILDRTVSPGLYLLGVTTDDNQFLSLKLFTN